MDAEIGLFIGTNAPKAIEPWQVIASADDGPYAIRTRLGWTINEPLREDTGHSKTSGLTEVSANQTRTLNLRWKFVKNPTFQSTQHSWVVSLKRAMP